jgi:hypothetical protein
MQVTDFGKWGAQLNLIASFFGGFANSGNCEIFAHLCFAFGKRPIVSIMTVNYQNLPVRSFSN